MQADDFSEPTESFGLFAILLNPRHWTPSYNLLFSLNDILLAIQPGLLLEPVVRSKQALDQ